MSLEMKTPWQIEQKYLYFLFFIFEQKYRCSNIKNKMYNYFELLLSQERKERVFTT